MRDFLIRGAALLISLCVFLGETAHISFADDLTLMEAFFTRPEVYSGMVEVPGRGLMRYYAQNDPLWGALAYERAETPSRRPFRDGGCGPTAGAMAIANLVSEDELPAIAAYAKQGYSLCSCSLNKEKCNKRHARYVLTTQRDFVRFLPLVFGDFATGNNVFDVYSRGESQGTGTGFLYEIAKAYGVSITATEDYNAAVLAIEQGDTVVGHASRGGAFTNTGHYLLIAHIDDERVYILDPLCRTAYNTYQGKKIEVIQPGLVALTHSDYAAANIGMYFIFHKN